MNPTMKQPSLAEATRIWFKIGYLGFGGPAGQIALMHRLIVEEKKWVGESQFLHALNFCMLLPGPEAQQLSVYLGWLLHGTRGGLIAGTLFVLPGLFVIWCLGMVYAVFQGNAWLNGVFFGLKAAILAVTIEALLRVARKALNGPFHFALAIGAFVLLFALNIPFPLVILSAALLGLAQSRFQRHEPDSPAHDFNRNGTAGTWRRFLSTTVIGLGLWLAPIAALLVFLGPTHLFTQLGLFFAKMAIVTFGGAYAVLSYVAQEAVNSFGWLSPHQMVDGLALAETTPGPLILVLSFVGFIAAFTAPGNLPPLWAGTLGLMLVTYVTFAPCFLWIFLGAPYVERLRRQKQLNAALAAITASVVGVIANLALWFSLHVLFAAVGTWHLGFIEFPWPDWRSADLAAFVITLAAAIALLRFKISLGYVLAASAGAGLIFSVIF